MEFKTVQEALENGYRLVNKNNDRDISGNNSFGYQYDNGKEKSEMIFFSTLKDRMGRLGAYLPMFPPNKT